MKQHLRYYCRQSEEKQCPICKREFATFPGMRLHLKKAHRKEYNEELTERLMEKEGNEAEGRGNEEGNERQWNRYELFLMAKEEASYAGRNINRHLATLLDRSVAAIKNRRSRPDYISVLKEHLNHMVDVTGNDCVGKDMPTTNQSSITNNQETAPDPNREWSRLELVNMAGWEVRYAGRFPNRYLAEKMVREESAIMKKRRTADYKRIISDLRAVNDNDLDNDDNDGVNDFNDNNENVDTYNTNIHEVICSDMTNRTIPGMTDDPGVFTNFEVQLPGTSGGINDVRLEQSENENIHINNNDNYVTNNDDINLNNEVGETDGNREIESFIEYLLELRPSVSDNSIYSEAISLALSGEIGMANIELMLADIRRCRASPAVQRSTARPVNRARREYRPQPIEQGYRGRAYLYKLSQEQYNDNIREFAKKIIDGKDLRKPAYVYPTLNDITEHYTQLWGERGRRIDTIPPRNEHLLNEFDMLKPITMEEIGSAMVNTKSNSAGPDGIRLNDVKKVPLNKLAILYNIMLMTALIPPSLKLSRTILIPKNETPGGIADWRPISITSIIIRTLHRILSKRINTDKLSPTQRGFVERDGLLENILTMQALVKECREKLAPHVMISVDIKKAFDTVCHDSIRNSLIRAGMPNIMLRYVMETLINSETFFETTNGRSDTITLLRGVKQGDPLSPKLFIIVMDELLCDLDRRFDGIKMGDVNISNLAYADDLVLWATDRKEGQLMLRCTDRFVESKGMTLHPEKCKVITVEKDHHRKKLIVNDRRKYFAGPTVIRSLNAIETQRYLGHGLDSMGLMETSLKNLVTYLKRITSAALKPHQKFNILKTYLIPRYIASLQTPVITMKKLKQADYFIRINVKKILHLPKTIPNAAIYAPKKEGGLGVFCFKTSIPVIIKERISKLKEQGDVKVGEILKGRWMEKLERRLDGWNSGFGSTKRDLRSYWGSCLDGSVSGGGLRQDVGLGNNWMEYPPKMWGGRGFISAMQLKYNMLPCVGGLQNANARFSDRRCRAGCQRIESVSHILQRCPNGHDLRIQRHDRAVETLAKYLRTTGNRQVEVEPRIRCSNGLLKKPDLVIVDDNITTVLEVGVHWEGPDGLDTAADNKIAIYSDEAFLNGIKERYGRGKTIRILPFILGARGTFPSCNSRAVDMLKLPKSLMIRTINDTIYDGIKIYKQFMRTIWARGHRFPP